MELKPGHEILNKDEKSILTIQFLLTEIPVPEWTHIFNRRDYFSNYEMLSIENSDIIYLKVDLPTYYKNDITYKVDYTIDKTDQELTSDVLKNEIILRQFVPGMIITHLRGELLYDNNPIYGDIVSDYEHYVKEIADRTQFY